MNTKDQAPTAPLQDLLVFIGRFQPLHFGHLDVLDQALANARHVLVLVGSANRPREARNPFTAQERIALFQRCLDAQTARRVTVEALEDLPDDRDWTGLVAAKAQACITDSLGTAPHLPRVGLIGHVKDATSYYLDLFPNWTILHAARRRELDATDVRRRFFANPRDPRLAQDVPAPVLAWLMRFAGRPTFAALRNQVLPLPAAA